MKGALGVPRGAATTANSEQNDALDGETEFNVIECVNDESDDGSQHGNVCASGEIAQYARV